MKNLSRLLALTTMLVSVPALAQQSNGAGISNSITENVNGVPILTPQTGQIYYRVPIPANNNTTPGTAYSWVPQVSACSNQCGTGTVTTSYACKDSSGNSVSSADCVAADGATPPSTSDSCTIYSGCTYSWIQPAPTITVIDIPPYPIGTLTCGEVQSTYSPYCRRSDGLVLSSADNSFCENSPGYSNSPSGFGGTTYSKVTTGCSASDFAWNVGAWSTWSSTCSATATQTRSVVCQRDFDSTVVPDANCTTAKPANTQTQPVYTSCTYAWAPGSWSAWAISTPPSGEPIAKQTRAVPCIQTDPATGNQTTVADSYCASAGTKPITSETLEYVDGSWSAPSSTCSTTASETRAETCTDQTGTAQSVATCTAAGLTEPATSQTVPTYTGCTYSWQTRGWGAPSSTCSATATETQTVTCLRSDGTTVANSYCNAATQPASSQTLGVYSGCTYSWQSGAWSAPSSTCSTSATETRSVTCLRSDGTTVANSNCSGSAPASSQTLGVYTGCTYAWNTGSWSAWTITTPSTGEPIASQTRSVTCVRSDGATVANSYCTAAEPITYQSLQFIDGAWSAPTSTCSATATESRTETCTDENGNSQSSATCTAAGLTQPATSQTVPTYSGCTYAWNTGPWSAWAVTTPSTGEPIASQTRSVTCVRSDGSTVANSYCTTAEPITYQSLQFVDGAWSGPSNTCSATATESRTETCTDENGNSQSSATCTSVGLAQPATTQTVPTYTGCTYAYQTGAWSAPNSTCSTGATETRSVVCIRSDGTAVANSNCSGSTPASSQVIGIFSGCNWTTQKTPGACNSGTQTVTNSCVGTDSGGNVQVTYSDPANVQNYCGVAASTTQSCTSTPYLSANLVIGQTSLCIACGVFLGGGGYTEYSYGYWAPTYFTYGGQTYLASAAVGSLSNTSFNGYTITGLYSSPIGNDVSLTISATSGTPPNSGWTTITIPGSGTLQRASACYTTSGNTATWDWGLACNYSLVKHPVSGTVTIK